MWYRFVCFLLALSGTYSLDNGLAQSPPMGFRTWNQFGLNVNQSLMEKIYEALTDVSRPVIGRENTPTSLKDLGYVHAGIDDGWQECGSGPSKKGFHNASGYPIFDSSKFPDVSAMTKKAKDAGLEPGWYGNNWCVFIAYA